MVQAFGMLESLIFHYIDAVTSELILFYRMSVRCTVFESPIAYAV